MKKNKNQHLMPAPPRRHTLQRTMITYFLLIGFASMMVGVEFWADFHRGALKSEIWENIRIYGQDDQHQEDIFAPIDRMRSKALLMVGIVMLVMVIVLTMFIKNITEPLQHMISLSEKISAGDLSQTIHIDANNELSDLSNVINEMSSNLQEIILLAQRICTQGRGFVEDTRRQLQNIPLDEIDAACLENRLSGIGEDLAMLDEMIAYFNFYSVEKQNDVG